MTRPEAKIMQVHSLSITMEKGFSIGLTWKRESDDQSVSRTISSELAKT